MSIATWSTSPSDSACPPTSPAPTPTSPSPASSRARAIPSATEVAKWYDASGCQPVARRRVAVPAVGQVELVPPDDQDLLARPHATHVVSRGRGDPERRTVNVGVGFVDEGMVAVEVAVVERPT